MYLTEVLVHYFQELESVYLLFTCWRPKFIAHPLYLYLSSDRQKKTTLPFLTAALRKHVQIHVIKTCRQASVTNSLATLNFFNFTNIHEWKKRFYALVRDCTTITSLSSVANSHFDPSLEWFHSITPSLRVRHLVIGQGGPSKTVDAIFATLRNFSTINKFFTTKLKSKRINIR